MGLRSCMVGKVPAIDRMMSLGSAHHRSIHHEWVASSWQSLFEVLVCLRNLFIISNFYSRFGCVLQLGGQNIWDRVFEIPMWIAKPKRKKAKRV